MRRQADERDGVEGTSGAARRPAVVAFDVVETLFSLAPVGEALRPLGVPLDLYFTRLLRDGFALAAAGGCRPFPDVARSVLAALAPDRGDDAIGDVLGAFGRLPAYPDAEPALRALVDDGIRVVTLTNGGADTTKRLLHGAGLAAYVDRVVSVDEAGAWKPSPRPYRHLAGMLGREPGELALVAVHAWDVHGAHEAGLVTGWCSRLEGRPTEIFQPADIEGPDLVAVADALLRVRLTPTGDLTARPALAPCRADGSADDATRRTRRPRHHRRAS